MYIQPCTSKSLVKGATLNFSSKNSHDDYNYYSYIAEKSNDIISISALGGTCVGFISAKDNLKREFIPKSLHNVGVATLALFGLASLNFFISEAKQPNKENKK